MLKFTTQETNVSHFQDKNVAEVEEKKADTEAPPVFKLGDQVKVRRKDRVFTIDSIRPHGKYGVAELPDDNFFTARQLEKAA